VLEYSRQVKAKIALKHICDVDLRRATSKVHMYWPKVQGLRVKP